MKITALIRNAFPQGLDYDDAAQLCLGLYSHSILSDDLMAQCTRELLPITFADLATSGFVRVEKVSVASRYGANFHDATDKGHWVEVIASIFKMTDTVDMERSMMLVNQLKDIRCQA